MNVGFLSDRLNRSKTGIGIYAYNLIREFAQIEKDPDNVYLINYEKTEDVYDLDEIIIGNPLQKYFEKSFYFWHLLLNYRLRKNTLNLDIVHSPESADLFIKLRCQKKIITVYDITPQLFPETFTSLTILRYKFLFAKSLNTADKIITISDNTKRDLITHYNIPPDKVVTIYLGVDRKFKPLDKRLIMKYKKTHDINFPFILYVGTLEPRKNITTLIKAFAKLKEEGIDHKLVLAGGKGWKYQSIFKLVEELHLQAEVVFMGYVSDEDLPSLYNAADLFVYPSLYEGFGLPPLEAMACGTPVITSNTSSFPEVIGTAGITVNPYDVSELVESIREVLSNDALHANLKEKGLIRAKCFSWEKCARETWNVYKELYAKL